jgi:hypothetical protein
MKDNHVKVARETLYSTHCKHGLPASLSKN